VEILKLNNGCNDISFGDQSILEGDRIRPLKSHEQALEEKLCFTIIIIINENDSGGVKSKDFKDT